MGISNSLRQILPSVPFTKLSIKVGPHRWFQSISVFEIASSIPFIIDHLFSNPRLGLSSITIWMHTFSEKLKRRIFFRPKMKLLSKRYVVKITLNKGKKLISFENLTLSKNNCMHNWENSHHISFQQSIFCLFLHTVRTEMAPDLTGLELYFWAAVNKRLTHLWPGYFLTQL